MKYIKEFLTEVKKIGEMAEEVTSVIRYLKEMNSISGTVDANGGIENVDFQKIVETLVRERLQEDAE